MGKTTTEFVNAVSGDGALVAFAGKTGFKCGDDEDKGSGKKP